MPYPWFRLYSEMRSDPKVLSLDDATFRVWINLLCLASESDERGIVGPFPLKGLAYAVGSVPDDISHQVKWLEDAGLVSVRDDNAIVITAWDKRQYDHPSDVPEKTRERKARQRTREKVETPRPKPETVTSMSRPIHETDTDTDTDTDVDKYVARAGARAKSDPPLVVKQEPREDQKLWDALALAILPNPKAGFTKGARGAWNDAIKQLREQEVTPEEVPRLAHNYEVKFGKKPPTPHAMVTHLPEIRGDWMETAPSRTNGRAQEPKRDAAYYAADPYLQKIRENARLEAEDRRRQLGLDSAVGGW